jgi:hypothetical protein
MHPLIRPAGGAGAAGPREISLLVLLRLRRSSTRNKKRKTKGQTHEH